MLLNLRLYMITCILLGFMSAIADGFLKNPNPIPYMTAGTSLVGGLCYILLLILGKWVD